MRVLLTRASAEAARTRAKLEALGHRVLVSPVIDIATLEWNWPTGVVDGVLATSGHAFAALAGGGPAAAARRLMPLWLVGGRTEAAARAHGYLGAAFVAPNAVALAFEMGKHRQRNRIIYLAGRDRKPDLETALRVTEQIVEVAQVYEARAVDRLNTDAVEAIRAHAVDAVLHYSRRSAELFTGLVTQAGLPEIPFHACLSEDVAEPLAARGWYATAAARPDEDALLSLFESIE